MRHGKITTVLPFAAVAAVIAAAALFPAGCGEEPQKIDLTLEEFRKYESSRFGFMHPERSYEFARELGIHWQRPHPGPFNRNEIERETGVYNWDQADRYVTESQDYGILIAATIWPYANWDQQKCHQKLPNSPRQDFPMLGDYRGKPCDAEAYRGFIRALVERYDGDGQEDMPGLKYPVRYWEVINEPEMSEDLLFFTGNPQSTEYLEVLRVTAGAVKEADSDARVLNGGIAALTPREKPFWVEVLGGGAASIDVLTVHAISAAEDLNLTALEALMKELGLDKPVWVTEIQFGKSKATAMQGAQAAGGGAPPAGQAPPPGEGPPPGEEPPPPGGGPPPPGEGPPPPGEEASPPRPQNLTPDQWAAVIIKAYVAAFGRGADKLFYVGLDNASPTEESALLVNCGEPKSPMKKGEKFNSADCQKQTPFHAFKTMVDKLNYFDTVKKLAEGQYRFDREEGPVYVLWGAGPLPAEIAGTVTVTDVFGFAREIDAAAVSLSDTPIFIEPK